MSSHVVVLDSTARRATVKTTPGKHLTDILQEACKKLGVEASQHGLKYKGKELDLSLVFRLSGLTPGAKLELVQLSRSPSVVTVALQLPESEARGAPSSRRLLDKFPSTTTIWLILRKFEAGVAGGASTRNLTGRGVPSGNEGAGRLYYETPVVQIMERELSSFTDLQKSLAQLGFNSGNVLLRLSFRRTEEPLEEAMVKIQDYFKPFDDATPKTEASPAPTEQPSQAESSNEAEESQQQPASTDESPWTSEQATPAVPTAPAAEPTEVPAGFSRPVTVFSPPSNATPQSAQTTYNETDYVPSIEHAKAHQRRLNATSRPQRLPTDAEIAAKAAAEEERLAAVKEVDVKVRLPDQSQVVAKFGQEDTGKSLYDFVRNCLAAPFANEKFIITSSLSGAAGTSGPGRNIQNIVPDSDQHLLIKDLAMIGRVLVNFTWDPTASPTARQSRELLKPALQTRAQELKVEQPPDVMDTSEDVSIPKPTSTGDGARGEKRKPGGMPKWLKLPGKK
ncbi:putative UBX domain protein [Aspergillus ibericus CBS 121593]|uniref:UBX domain protein n=1 Tax=Aspergillus ibericus CBS 121593 TaxID=1448316 RepID=A0A395HDU0_9EURO|nr:UBX domain protein [Aspergillus ibericus CBS 121593]RAL05836.1 UBX domain protein [Aspergillus ibericus CBS 121593]